MPFVKNSESCPSKHDITSSSCPYGVRRISVLECSNVPLHWTDQARVSFWDGLIVAAAERMRCRFLLSEDFQTGREFGSITIVNPFETSPPN